MKCIGLTPSSDKVEDMIKSVDKDQSGTLDFEEFKTLVSQEVTKSKMSYVRKFFQLYDTDKDGVITVNEVRQSLKKAGYSDEHIKSVIEEFLGDADFDKDEQVSFEGI